MLGAFAMSPQSDNRLQLALAYIAIEEGLFCSSLVLHAIPWHRQLHVQDIAFSRVSSQLKKISSPVRQPLALLIKKVFWLNIEVRIV